MKVLFSSASDRWATPPDVYAALNDESQSEWSDFLNETQEYAK